MEEEVAPKLPPSSSSSSSSSVTEIVMEIRQQAKRRVRQLFDSTARISPLPLSTPPPHPPAAADASPLLSPSSSSPLPSLPVERVIQTRELYTPQDPLHENYIVGNTSLITGARPVVPVQGRLVGGDGSSRMEWVDRGISAGWSSPMPLEDWSEDWRGGEGGLASSQQASTEIQLRSELRSLEGAKERGEKELEGTRSPTRVELGEQAELVQALEEQKRREEHRNEAICQFAFSDTFRRLNSFF